MARFLLSGTYTAEGLAATRSVGLTARTKAVKKAVESLGGKLLGMYWTTAPDDSLLIVEFPEAGPLIGFVTRVKAAGVANVSVTRLFDGAEFDAVVNAGEAMKYAPPTA